MLLAFDGGSLMYRMVYAHTKQALSTTNGGTGTLFFLLKSLRSYIMSFHPDRVIMVMDAGYSERRRSLNADYKSGRGLRLDGTEDVERQAIMEDIRRQRAWAEKMLPAFGVRKIKLAGREADDLLAQLALEAERRQERMVIVSDDKDMLQLIGPNVEVFRPRADETVTAENFLEKTGVSTPEQWLTWKCIVGDSSDRVPGVHGVGEKSAVMAVQAGLTLDVDSLISMTEHSNKRVRLIGEQLDTVLFNRDLLDLYAEEFSEELIQRIHDSAYKGLTHVSLKDVMDWCKKFEFASILSDLQNWITPFESIR